MNGDKFHIPAWKGCIFIKKSILPKLFYRFNVIQMNIPEGEFMDLVKCFYSYFGKINGEELKC